MQATEMGTFLCEAASKVLEMMCASPVLRDQEFPPPNVKDPILAQLSFVGQVNGHFTLAAELPVCQSLAMAFMCAEEPPPRQQAVEVLVELGNMLCGQFLAQLKYDESFALTSPVEVSLEHVAAQIANLNGHSYQRSVFLEAGVLSMLVVIEKEAFIQAA